MVLDELTRAEKLIAGAGIVLVVVLVFLPWHSVDLGLVAWSRSAIEGPNAALGLLAVLLTVAVVAVTLLRALRPGTALPDLPVGWDRATLLAAATTLALLVLKLALDTDRLGIGAGLGLLLAGTATYGAHLQVQDRRALVGDVAE